MQEHPSRPWYHGRIWTLSLCVTMVVVNFGLLAETSQSARSLLDAFQFDRAAILHGQVWRLITGNLVHWSVEHFLLDVGVFLVVGILYEPALRRQYPWFLLASAVSVSLGVLVFLPEMSIYRGLSGVDSGQFVLALAVESQLAWHERRRWLWLAPALAIFTLKLFWENTTGQMFFGTESLGNIGLPTPLAHLAGAAAVAALWIGHGAIRRNAAFCLPLAHYRPLATKIYRG